MVEGTVLLHEDHHVLNVLDGARGPVRRDFHGPGDALAHHLGNCSASRTCGGQLKKTTAVETCHGGAPNALAFDVPRRELFQRSVTAPCTRPEYQEASQVTDPIQAAPREPRRRASTSNSASARTKCPCGCTTHRWRRHPPECRRRPSCLRGRAGTIGGCPPWNPCPHV